MKLIDAYKMTLESIEFLKSKGLKVEINESKSRSDTDITSKYKSPDRLPPDKWIHVSIEIPDDKDLQKLIFDEQRKLMNNNISFDTGSGCGVRDWELDWSFHIMYDEIEFSALKISLDTKTTVSVEFFTNSRKIFIGDIIRLESLDNNNKRKIINLIVNKINLDKNSDKFQVISKQYGYYGKNIESYRNLDLIKFIKSNISIKLLDKDESELIRCSVGYL